MADLVYSKDQEEIIEQPVQTRIFLEGPAGSGKTTSAIRRLISLFESGVRGEETLVLLPQRTLGLPYYNLQRNSQVFGNRLFTITTMYGLARRLIELFWPVISEEAGFTRPFAVPKFLNMETAQYFMSHLVRPLLDEGYFETVTIPRNRLYSQILDNLNKSALVGFPHQEIGERLKAAWIGEYSQLRVYDDVQTCANLFREYCYQNNYLDLSLQIEILTRYLWNNLFVRLYLHNQYNHLIYDNVEEDTPVVHDIILDWSKQFSSLLIIQDWDAGYRTFLGADPDSAYRLKPTCENQKVFRNIFTSSRGLRLLENQLGDKFYPPAKELLPAIPFTPYLDPSMVSTGDDYRIAEKNHDSLPVQFVVQRYFPEMLERIAEQVRKLVVDEGVYPEDVVIISPYLPDTLRFTLNYYLEKAGVPARSHRPSRSLGDEPTTRCLFTLAKIASPEWGFRPPRTDVANALFQAIDGLDLVRAQLLTEVVYRIYDQKPTLTSFEIINSEMQERITYRIGMKYEVLRTWLMQRASNSEEQNVPKEELDHFLGRLFGEVLSQPGFGFHKSLDSGVITANLIESIQQFRETTRELSGKGIDSTGKEYIEVVEEGLIASQYLPGWHSRQQQGVLISPAISFCLANYPVDYQVWLDIGSRGWYERLDQPLTHPYVLNRNWSPGRPWTDIDEVKTGDMQLIRLIRGLLRRCRKGIIIGLSELDDQGYEERGRLLQAFQEILIGSLGI